MLSAGISWARMAQTSESDFVLETQDTQIQVLKNGGHLATIENTYLVQTTRGAERFQKETINYDSTFQKVRVLQAEVRFEKTITRISSRQIEDQKISVKGGVGNARQIQISFLNLQPGARVYYKYEIEAEPELPQFFSKLFLFGIHHAQQQGTIRIKSVIPLFSRTHDPDAYLEVSETKKSAAHELVIKIKKPAIFATINEPQSLIRPLEVPTVQVSTFESWSQFAKALSPQWEAYLSHDPSGPFGEILTEAKSQTHPRERILAVVKGVRSKLEYLGDWRSQEHHFFPRPWRDLVASRFGDCKDFAALTALLLRNLGFAAEIALAKTISPPEFSPLRDLPTFQAFNHALVLVKLPEGPIWLDPARKVPSIEDLTVDLANSEAYVLTGPQPNFHKVPETSFTSSIIEVQRDVTITPTRALKIQGQINLVGGEALRIKDLSIKKGSPEFEPILWPWIGSESQAEFESLDVSNHDDSGPQPIQASYQTQIPATISAANEPFYYAALPRQISKILFNTTDRTHDAWLGRPITLKRKIKIQNLTLNKAESHGCWIVSPWFDLNRYVFSQDSKTWVEDEILFRKAEITAAEIKSREFQWLQSDLHQCAEQGWISFVQKSTEPPPLPEKEAEPLPWDIVGKRIWNRLQSQLTEWLPSIAVYVPTFEAEELTVASKIPPPLPPLQTSHDILRAWSGDREELMKARDWIYHKDGKNPEAPKAKVQLGQILRLIGSSKDDLPRHEYSARALEIADSILAQQPLDLDGTLLKAQSLFDLGRFDEAQGLLAGLNPTTLQDPQVQLVTAEGHKISRRYSEAVATLNRLASQPGDPRQRAALFVKLAQIYKLSGEPEFEKKALQSAVLLDPRSPTLRYRLAALYSEAGQSDMAISELETILELQAYKPAKWSLAREYGRKAAKLYQEGRKLEESGRLFGLAADLDPSWDEGQYNLGLYYQALARLRDDNSYLARADQAFKKCLALNPQHSSAKQMLEALHARQPAQAQPSPDSP